MSGPLLAPGRQRVEPGAAQGALHAAWTGPCVILLSGLSLWRRSCGGADFFGGGGGQGGEGSIEDNDLRNNGQGPLHVGQASMPRLVVGSNVVT